MDYSKSCLIINDANNYYILKKIFKYFKYKSYKQILYDDITIVIKSKKNNSFNVFLKIKYIDNKFYLIKYKKNNLHLELFKEYSLSYYTIKLINNVKNDVHILIYNNLYFHKNINYKN